MEFYKVRRYWRSTGAFYDTVVIQSSLDVRATTEQLEKRNGDHIYRLDKIRIATVDRFGVHD